MFKNSVSSHKKAAGHWNMKNSATERRNFSDEVTAAIRQLFGIDFKSASNADAH